MKYFQEDQYVSFDCGVTEVGIAITRPLPARYGRITTRLDAARAMGEWFETVLTPFGCTKDGKRDAQQLRKQPIGTLTLYFWWGDVPAVVGLRRKTRNTTFPQQPVRLAPRTAILLTKDDPNSITVSLCKGDARKFWAFQCKGGGEADDEDCAKGSEPTSSAGAEDDEHEKEAPDV